MSAGSSGAIVSDVQERLRGLGFDPGAVDGRFGSSTAAAVRAFQAARGISPDGVVGPETWAALDRA